MKRFLQKILRNKKIRNLFNLPWNPYYDTTFYDTATSFEEAVSKINKSNKFKNYDDTLKIIKKDINNIKNLKIQNGIEVAILPIVVSLFNEYKKNNSQIIVLDVGAGIYPISLYIKKYANLDIFSYVIETEEYTEKLKKIIPDHNLNVEYSNTIEDFHLEKSNIIYFGSSLQYFEGKEYHLLEKIVKSKPEYIIISRNFFLKEKDDLFSLQAYGRNHLIPHKFFSYTKIINFFKKNNYKLLFFCNHSTNHIHNKLEKKDYDYKTIIFINNSN